MRGEVDDAFAWLERAYDQRDAGVQALSELARDLDFAEAGRVRIGSRHRKEDRQHDATDGEDRTRSLSRAKGSFRC